LRKAHTRRFFSSQAPEIYGVVGASTPIHFQVDYGVKFRLAIFYRLG
jgi:hypothetical protein